MLRRGAIVRSASWLAATRGAPTTRYTFHVQTDGTMHMTGTRNQQTSNGSGMVERSWVVDAAAFTVLVGSGVALRLACHDIPNFAPVAALALFAGYFFRSSLLALLVPLSVMAISDRFVGGYHWGMMAIVYGMLALPVAFRGWLRRAFDLHTTRPALPLLGLFGCGLMSSLLFFVVTNFGVWCLFGTYDRSLAGLASCYVAAIPFFRYTLCGDLFFTIVLFGSYAAVLSWIRTRDVAAELN